MKIILTESQYKKVLIREFGETENDPKEWYHRILNWVEGDRSRLQFDSNEYEDEMEEDDASYGDDFFPEMNIRIGGDNVFLGGDRYRGANLINVESEFLTLKADYDNDDHIDIREMTYDIVDITGSSELNNKIIRGYIEAIDILSKSKKDATRFIEDLL